MDARIERIDYRLGTLETDVMSLRNTMYQMLADLRKDVHNTTAPLGLELNEKRSETQRIYDMLAVLLQRVTRIEETIAQDREERPARQDELNKRLEKIEAAQAHSAPPRPVWPIVLPWGLLCLVLGIAVGVMV